MKKLLAGLAAAAVALVALAPAANAGPRRMRGEFDAHAIPFPLDGSLVSGGCANGVEGIHKVSKTFTARFGGFLTARLDGFEGDWDLRLFDADGEERASSTTFNPISYPYEELVTYVRRGEKLTLTACNWAGSTDARAEYELIEARDPRDMPLVKKRVRDVYGSYIGPAVGTSITGSYLCHVGVELGCTAFDAYGWPYERFIRIEIEDNLHDLPVAANFYQMYDDTTVAPPTPICGKTTKPIEIHPDANWIGVEIFAGPCADGTPAMATQGEVHFKVSSRP